MFLPKCLLLLVCTVVVLSALCANTALSAANAQAAATPFPATPLTWTSPGHTKYYVDSVNGNDANDGKSPSHAWQSLTNVNNGIFAGGDWILLKSGCHWDSGFSPAGSGVDKHPIKVTSYGDGPLPSLDAHATDLATVTIHNGEFWDIENLDITNTSAVPVPFLRGVEVRLLNFGTAHGIVLRNLNVHDINSAEDKEHGGSGIFIDNHGDQVLTRFDGILIENCRLTHTDRNGISMDSGYTDRSKWYPNLNVIIRGNQLTDIGGDCILAIGCDGALIEHNTVQGGRERAKDWASGIWVWSCDNSIIQFNESSGMVGTMDAQGFDADWNTRNTLIQYNYSHDNGGGFVMVVNNGGAKPPGNAGNTGTIVRYNISENDAYRTFTVCGSTENTQFYNNDVYVGKNDSPDIFFSWNWGGAWPDNTTFSNNIFYVDGKVNVDMRQMTNIAFNNNVYFGSFNKLPTDAKGLTMDPLLTAPGTAGVGTNNLNAYQLLPHSPCKDAGVVVPGNGGRDYWGKKVPAYEPPNIGASQG